MIDATTSCIHTIGGELCGVGVIQCEVPAIGGTGEHQGADFVSRDCSDEGQACTTGGETGTSITAGCVEQSFPLNRVGIRK